MADDKKKVADKPAKEPRVDEKPVVEDKPAEEPKAEEATAPAAPSDDAAAPADDKAAPAAPKDDAAPVGTDPQGRQLYEVTCAECGKKTQVPFRPSGDRPVYCRDCYMQKKRG